MNTHILKDGAKGKISSLKESYGPFKDYATYKNALKKWNDSAKENNDKYYEEFKADLYEAVSQVFAKYYMQYGCRYSEKDAQRALAKFFEDPDPFEFADLIDNEDDFEEHNYYDESSERNENVEALHENKEILKEASAVEKRLREREQYYKDMKELFHK